MDFTITETDSVMEIINRRIGYLKEVHEENDDHRTRELCQVKINTLEMVLDDVCTLGSLKRQM
jgi:hypothetical protein